MDGNFAIALTLFEQLYAIRAPLGSSYVTCVFALLSGKSQVEYVELLTAVVGKTMWRAYFLYV